MRRVVVTGLGAISPVGLDAPSSWSAILEGSSGLGKITSFDATGWPVQIAAEIPDFQPKYLDARSLRRMDRFTQLAVEASAEALLDAQLSLDEPLGEEAGVYIGSGIGGILEIAAGAERIKERGPRGLGALFITKSLANLASGMAAIRFGAKGPSLTISTACAAGNHSIGEAYRTIATGAADLMLAGGAEAAISPLGLGGFMVMRALSKRNEYPEGASRPFDQDRDGFVMGEGAAILVLEELSHAQARGSKIYAELVGYGQTCDAHHISAPPDRHEGAGRSMRAALRSASILPSDVGYINAHGTSTPLNDLCEAEAIEDIFGGSGYWVSSTKGATGHLLGASGGLEAVFTVLALRDGLLPATANLKVQDPRINIPIIKEDPLKLQVEYAMSNAFGFGGVNAVLVFRAWSEGS